MRLSESPTVPLVLCIAALLACKQGSTGSSSDENKNKGKEKPEKTVESKAKEPDGATVAAVKPGENKPGPAYFAVEDSGIVMIDAGQASLVQPLRFMVQDMVYGGDGAVWVSAISGVYRIVGKQAKAVSQTGFQAIAVVNEKDVYAVNYAGVHHYDGSSWSAEDKSAIGASLLQDVEVDKAGNLWVMSTNTLHQKKKGEKTWATVDISKAVSSKPYFQDLAKGPDGTLYAAHSSGLIKLESGEWKKVAGDFGFMGTNKIDVSPTGLVAATGGTDKLYLFGPSGQTKIDPASAGLKVRSFKEVAIDGSGRVWLPTDHGVVVLDEKGKQIQHWPPATLEGVTGEVAQIIVVGAGPTQLPAPGAAATGTVKGKVLKAGSAAVGADIQLCNSPAMLFRATPCEDKPFTKATKTDAKGEFTIPEVPIGSYGFAIKTSGAKWMITLGSDCCTKMKKGQEYDVGALKLE